MYIALPLPPRLVSKTEMEPKLNGMDWFKGKQIIANHGLVTSYKGFLVPPNTPAQLPECSFVSPHMPVDIRDVNSKMNY